MYSFYCYGHENILAKHKNTFEFTKDEHLSKNGDCILGVKADFSLQKIKEEISGKKNIKVTVIVDNMKEEFFCNVNPLFNDDKEIVFRRGNFQSSRTLGIFCNRACSDINDKFRQSLKDRNKKIKVIIE